MVTEKEKKHVDLLPNGYKIVRQSLVDDLEGEKKVCWETEILQDDDSGFTMKSAGVCISIPVRNMAMQSSAKYFATMTGMLMEY